MQKKVWLVFAAISVVNVCLIIYAVFSKTWGMIFAIIAEWFGVFVSLYELRRRQISNEKPANVYSVSNILPASLSLVAVFLLICKLLFPTLDYYWIDILVVFMLLVSTIFNWRNVFKR